MLVFRPAHQVASPWERWHPFAIHQTGVPADMIDVQMGAQHGINRFCRKSRRRKIGQKRPVAVVPVRDPALLLVVPKAGIHHDAPIRRFHDEAVDAHAQPPILIGEMRAQPGDRQDLLPRCLRQQEPGSPGHLQFDDLGDRDVADGPFHRICPPLCGQTILSPIGWHDNGPTACFLARFTRSERSARHDPAVSMPFPPPCANPRAPSGSASKPIGGRAWPCTSTTTSP